MKEPKQTLLGALAKPDDPRRESRLVPGLDRKLFECAVLRRDAIYHDFEQQDHGGEKEQEEVVVVFLMWSIRER